MPVIRDGVQYTKLAIELDADVHDMFSEIVFNKGKLNKDVLTNFVQQYIVNNRHKLAKQPVIERTSKGYKIRPGK